MSREEIIYKISNYCDNCNEVVETGVIFTYTYNHTFLDEDRDWGMGVVLSKCLKCEQPQLFEQSFENIDLHSIEGDRIQLYPSAENVALRNAPTIVTNPYKEALKCYRGQAYEACTIMCRKSIEAICKDKGESKGTLAAQLKNLNSKKVLEDTFYNWANELRLIGNDGAHSHDLIINKKDAKDSLDFLDSLITYLYHLVDKYDKLKLRRSK